MTQESAGREEDGFLRRALDTIVHPVCIVDVHSYRILYTNPAAREFADRAQATTCFEFLYGSTGPCDSPERPCPLVSLLRERNPVVVEHIVPGEGPLPQTFEIHASPIFDDEGVLTHAVLVLVDATSSRVAAQEIACSGLELSGIVEHSPVLYLLVDQDQRIWRANKAVYSLIPRVEASIIGQRLGEAFHCVHAHDDPRGCGFGPACDECTVRRLVTETFTQGAGLERHEVEMEIQTNGSAHTRHFLAWTSFLPNLPRSLILVVLEDITPLREIEEEVQQLVSYRNQFNRITAEMVRVADLPGLLDLLSRSLSQACRVEWSGAWVDDVAVSRGLPTEIIHQEVARARVEGIVPDRILTWPPGEDLEPRVYTWFSQVVKRYGLRTLLLAPIYVNERVVGGIGLGSFQKSHWHANEISLIEMVSRESSIVIERLRLIRHLKEMNALLEKALQVREIVLQNVSHELRTPLTLLKGYVELLAEGMLGDLTEQQRKAVDVMRRHVDRLQFMVERLILMSALHSYQLHREPLDMGPWLQRVVEDWQHQAQMSNVTLDLNVSEDLPPVQVDEGLFRHVLDNLISNAIKFSQQEGRVRVRAWCEEKDFHLTVSDEGIGIPPEDLKRIFDRFYQVDAQPSRRFEGLGIGLSLVRDIVELHEGRVWAESEGVGRGATFHIVLPCGGTAAD